ncbi:uncharacterized protein LOC124134710 isoform X1 [Haliotis rufescens]|uniref:uncharacterized protein LOC124134710 isoform X1 n=1 Tax=Haliotis rufescens TaxID=6454 RepID=UPI00201FA15A|nr:uncharacterized protein LOC124134710 isoform X1 [Haliotis rufescens]XP_046355705.2 uncharacterized protein LOC124134710 isoform X1 [Haliotis rufescens]XP_048237736.1 uncharacterized protein LOC124134710 isoform X1 [Haliotis rufescens]
MESKMNSKEVPQNLSIRASEKVLTKSTSLDSTIPPQEKAVLKRGDAVHASDSEDDISEENLPDPKMLFRRNSDARKCVSVRKPLRNDSKNAPQNREAFRKQRRFSSPNNCFDLNKSFNFGTEYHKDTSESAKGVPRTTKGNTLSPRGVKQEDVKQRRVSTNAIVTGKQNKDSVPVESVPVSPRDHVRSVEIPNCPNQVENGRKMSRVEVLLSNNLFKKHLSNHADILQKHTLSSRRYGLRKSVSNIDISCLEFGQSALSSVNQTQGSGKSESLGKESLDSKNDVNSPSAVISRRLTKQMRRTSMSSLDISVIGDFLSSSQPNFKEGPSKRKKINIPTFEEFRKLRSFVSNNWRGSAQISEPPNPKSSTTGDDVSGAENVRGLDTITEDDPSEHEADQNRSVSNLAKTLAQFKLNQSVPVSVSSSDNNCKISMEEKVSQSDVSCDTRTLGEREQLTEESVKSHVSVPSGTPSCVIQGGNSDPTHLLDNMDVQLDEDVILENTDAIDSARLCDLAQSYSRKQSQAGKQSHSETLSQAGKHSKEGQLSQAEKHSQSGKHTKEQLYSGPESHSRVQSQSGPQSHSREQSQSGPQSHSREQSQSGPQSHSREQSQSGPQSHSREQSQSGPQSHSRDQSQSGPQSHSRDQSQSREQSQSGPQSHEDAAQSHEDAAQSHEDAAQSHDIIFANKDVRSKIKPETYTENVQSVLRSISDVSMMSEGHKKRRERKERPYKSEPFAGAETFGNMAHCYRHGGRGPLQSTPQKDVLSLPGSVSGLSDTPSYPSLEELQEGEATELESDTSSEGTSKMRSNVSTTSNDSGVIGGADGSHDLSFDTVFVDSPNSSLNNLFPRASSYSDNEIKMKQQHTSSPQAGETENIPCPDCNPRAMPPQPAPNEDVPPPCPCCLSMRSERRETIQEIVETEISYGRDLKILRDEFYTPMRQNGMLNSEQLEVVFTNLHELIQVNEQFLHKLQSEVATAANNNEENLSSVCIGSLFVESSSMFLAFENYCVNQGQASQSLEQIEKEKDLVHAFLQAIQRDNSLLRRMHLKSFLMVPVQRIMKYPLLLSRLYKSTPSLHTDKEDIKVAQGKIEDILEHINAKTKLTGSGSFRIKRKRSQSRRYSLTEKIEVNRVAMEVLGWNKKEVNDLITSRLMYATPTDHTWAAKRCKNLKFTTIHGVLLTLGQAKHEKRDREHYLVFPKPNFVQQAAVVLIREKNGKYQPVRDPLMLDKCVVTVDPDFDEVFELHEWGREALVFKAEEGSNTRLWVQHLKQQTRDLGQWRRRRNALPNIMFKNMV